MAERTSPLRILLADDHVTVRQGLKLLIDAERDMTVIGEASDGDEAVQKSHDLNPDVVVMDISMPGMGGLEAVSRLLAKDPAVKILILSAHEDSIHPKRLLKAGAAGYLSKRVAPEELIHAIHEVAAGSIFLDSTLAQTMAEQALAGKAPVEILSDREFEIFMLLAKGQSVAHIATALFVSPRTVGTHLYNIKQKLNAANSAELTLIALRNGLLDH
jgi:two-component system invasion response regulator UvrY